MDSTLHADEAQDKILIKWCMKNAPENRATLPPYLKRTHQTNPANGLWVFAGPHCWQRAQKASKTASHRMIAVLPPERPYAPHYLWPVEHMDVLVQYYDGGGASKLALKILITHLLDAGAAVVRVLHPNYRLTIH